MPNTVTAQILDGKMTASHILDGIRARVDHLRLKGQRSPGLAVVVVGDDSASDVYVEQKEKYCRNLGFKSVLRRLSRDVTEEQLLESVESLNSDPLIDGILVQLPLPANVDSERIIAAVDPRKDVDGFHPINVGRLVTGLGGMEPCTPKGVMALLDAYGIELEGANAVVIGASDIVGKPMAHMLLARNATVTVCHVMTRDLVSFTSNADVIVVAVGKPGLLTSDMVRKGVVVVDVGINRVEGSLVGDADFDALKEKASWITPVPGGVGPMTIAMLMKNTLESYEAKV